MLNRFPIVLLENMFLMVNNLYKPKIGYDILIIYMAKYWAKRKDFLSSTMLRVYIIVFLA